MKNILIPTDFNLKSLNSLKYAIELYKDTTIKFVLLHMMKVPSSIPELLTMPRDYDIVEKIDPEFEKALKRFRREYIVEIDSIEIMHAYGSIVQQVNAHIEMMDIDVVLFPESVMKEHTPYEEYLQLFDECSAPVLFVPENYSNKSPAHIAYLADINDKNTLDHTALMSEIASDNNAHFILCFIIKDEKDIGKLTANFLSLIRYFSAQDMGYTLQFIPEKHFKKGVNEFIRTYNIDMMLLGTRKKFAIFTTAMQRRVKAITEARVPFIALSR
ncbi:MAG: universal stress protein [Cyclobacteriaceae bacterium]|nr:universal stress protein [Cyclobacteriaceae bacterium]